MKKKKPKISLHSVIIPLLHFCHPHDIISHILHPLQELKESLQVPPNLLLPFLLCSPHTVDSGTPPLFSGDRWHSHEKLRGKMEVEKRKTERNSERGMRETRFCQK
jgi:hypothetical protein